MLSHKTVYLNSAFQLVEILSPVGPNGLREKTRLFRGQYDADFGLVPSTHRAAGLGSAQAYYGKRDITVSEQIQFEAALLQEFLNACDASGLAVAGDNAEVRNMIKDAEHYYAQSWLWPPNAMDPLLAVAQHHGCPTCLLDWSRRGFVAAYFGASEAIKQVSPPSHLAVWELNTHDVEPYSGLSLVELPGGVSRNLAAQAGVFTVIRMVDHLDGMFQPQTIGHIDTTSQSVTVSLKKYILPISEAVTLLDILEQFGVSGATLFPGFEGVGHQVAVWAAKKRSLPNEKPHPEVWPKISK